MALSERQLIDALSRTLFVDSADLARMLGEAHATVHRAPASLLADGIVGRVSHGTAQLPSSRRYHLTAQGVGEAAVILGFGTPSDFVRAYPMSREWLTLLIRRMDRGGRRLSPRSVALPRHPRAPAPRGVPPQKALRRHHHSARRPQLRRGAPGLALRRRSLYDRLRAIADATLDPLPGDRPNCTLSPDPRGPVLGPVPR